MLKVPQLDDITYNQILQRAISRIPGKTEEWTDFNHHDPGITVLQTYSWLIDMLNYYMDATGDVHIHKYLKLLGIRQHRFCHAQAYLSVMLKKEEARLLKGMRVYASDICFELAKTQSVSQNLFISYINEADGEGIDLTAFAGVDGEYADLFAEEFKDQACAYLGFEKELCGKQVLQVCVQEHPERNPFDDSFSMIHLKWQYYSEDGWEDITEITDSTCGFLSGGMIEINLLKPTKPFVHQNGTVSAHYIRCILDKYTYDVRPRLGTVYVNPVLAEQKKTISKVEEITYQGEVKLELPFHIPENAVLMVGVKDGDKAGRLIYGDSLEATCIDEKDGPTPFERVLEFSADQKMVEAGSTLQIFCIEEEFIPDFRQEKTNGCANQEIYFPYPLLYEISVSTWEKDEAGIFRYEFWNYTPKLYEAGYRDQVFTYDFMERKIIFGDGINGKVPRQGQYICITKLCQSRLSVGNVVEGGICAPEAEDLPYQIKNYQKAFGGVNRESTKDMLKRMEKELFCQQRMVSPEDYEVIVKKTPGLIIEGVKVLSGKRYGELTDTELDDNEVVLVVKPYSHKDRPVLSDYYKEKIMEHIEDKRLINTKVRLVSPTYVGIEVRGKLRLLSQNRKQEVIAYIRDMIEQEEEPAFGKSVILGKLFTKLELLKQVQKIYELNLERIGTGAVKNQRGDILLDEKSLCYVSLIELECC